MVIWQKCPILKRILSPSNLVQTLLWQTACLKLANTSITHFSLIGKKRLLYTKNQLDLAISACLQLANFAPIGNSYSYFLSTPTRKSITITFSNITLKCLLLITMVELRCTIQWIVYSMIPSLIQTKHKSHIISFVGKAHIFPGLPLKKRNDKTILPNMMMVFVSQMCKGLSENGGVKL